MEGSSYWKLQREREHACERAPGSLAGAEILDGGIQIGTGGGSTVREMGGENKHPVSLYFCPLIFS